MAVSKEEFRKAVGCFATGVTVITIAAGEGRVHGMTANAFTSVSLEPLLVLVCVDHHARTHPLVHAHKRFGTNVLAEDQQALADYYAHTAQDHESAHRLGARYWYTERGTPMLEGCLAHLECRVVSAHDEGDHTIFIGEVEHVDAREGRPLLFYAGRYGRLEAP
ncbi:MAG: flavin reductase family protein [Chloroflexi bacterium]|nr:flavin reductase family protein [Chloroflexota bacterium]